MRKNRVPLVIPCHRVVGSNGLGGYSGAAGLATKRRLLELEGLLAAASAPEGRKKLAQGQGSAS